MALRKPKMKKLPKKPKAGASSETMKRYLKNVADIERENKKRLADYNREKKSREQLRRKIQNI